MKSGLVTGLFIFLSSASFAQDESEAVDKPSSASVFNCFDKYEVERKTLVEKGIVLIEDSQLNGAESIVGITLIKSSQASVWAWANNWELISEKVTGIDYYKIIHTEKTENPNQWKNIIKARLGLPLIKIYYYLLVSFDKESGDIEWHMLDENEQAHFSREAVSFDPPNSDRLKAIAGKSTMKAISADETLYCYAPIVEVNGNVPGFIRKFLSETMLKSYLNTMKDDLENDSI